MSIGPARSAAATRRPARRIGPGIGVFLVPVLAVLALANTGPAHAEVYRWVDEQGKTHFSDRPPAAATAESVDLPQGPDAADRQAAEERARRLIELDQRKTEIRRRNKERDDREAVEARRTEAERRSTCARARRDLTALRRQVRVYWTDERGERVYVEDNERAERIRQLQRFVDANCPG